MKPEALATITAADLRTVGWLAKNLGGRSLQGVRDALARLNIQPAVKEGRITLYPEEPTLSLLREGMRSANHSKATV